MKEYKLKTDAMIYYDTDIVTAFGGKFNGYYASWLSERIGCRFIISLRGSDTYTVNAPKNKADTSLKRQEEQRKYYASLRNGQKCVEPQPRIIK